MTHSWPGQLVAYIATRADQDFGPGTWISVPSRHCAKCGKTRRQARGVPCVDEPEQADGLTASKAREFVEWRGCEVEVVG